MLSRLIDIQYQRNDISLRAASSASAATTSRSGAAPRNGYRIELFGDEVEAGHAHQPAHGRDPAARETYHLPRQALRHPGGAHRRATGEKYRQELDERLAHFKTEGKLLEAQRLGGSHALRPRDAAARSAIAPASRTTPASSPAASRASRPTR